MAKKRAWRAENRDILSKKAAERMSCPDRRATKRAKDREYRAGERPRYRAHRANRRALEKNAEGLHTAEDIIRIKAEFGGLCAYCDDPSEPMDHMTPLTRGGSNWPENLQPLCGYHNDQKNNKTDAEYRIWAGQPATGKFIATPKRTSRRAR